jgi:hypothetical protein
MIQWPESVPCRGELGYVHLSFFLGGKAQIVASPVTRIGHGFRGPGQFSSPLYIAGLIPNRPWESQDRNDRLGWRSHCLLTTLPVGAIIQFTGHFGRRHCPKAPTLGPAMADAAGSQPIPNRGTARGIVRSLCNDALKNHGSGGSGATSFHWQEPRSSEIPRRASTS